MSAGRPPFSFILLDLPSDHELDDRLVTECDMLRAMLHNRGFKSKIKVIRATSTHAVQSIPDRLYPKVGFVHLSAHGGPEGVGLVGGSMSWASIGSVVTKLVPPLGRDQQRVLSLSCCHSEDGYSALRHRLRKYYTGVYHFAEDGIGFAGNGGGDLNP